MSTFYVRSTDGLDTDNGSTWPLAKATIAAALTASAAGDTIFVSQVHAEAQAANLTLTMSGTQANPSRVICGNDAATPPTAIASTASVQTTGANSISVRGSGYIQGLQFKAGNGFNYCQLYVNVNNTAPSSLHLENCDLNLIDSHPSSFILIGSDTTGDGSFTKLSNCRIGIASSNQKISIATTVHMTGCSAIPGTATSPGHFYVGLPGKDTNLLIENSDFSGLAATFTPFFLSNNGGAIVIMRNCKLPAGWSGSLVASALTMGTQRVEMHNCDAGPTNYKTWIEAYEGSIKSEIVNVKTGGATDGTTPKSLKLTSNANCSEGVGLSSPLISDWIDTTGTAKTITVDILHDSATALTNAEVWLEVDYLGSASTPQGTKASSKRATVLTAATAQTTSAATWTTTGLTNPNKQKLSVTFTPQMKGEFLARVVLAKPSKTIYVDPVAQVS